jgi:hypothetical protein
VCPQLGLEQKLREQGFDDAANKELRADPQDWERQRNCDRTRGEQMEIDKQEKEQRDWTGYGSADRPAVVSYYYVEDDHGVHRLLSMNDRAIWDIFGDQATFELHLAARYRSAELVGSGKVIVKPADRTAIVPEETLEIKRRIGELRTKHPGIRLEPWMPERLLDQQKRDKAVPPTIVPDDSPSAPIDSPENLTDELLAQISRAIFDRVAPIVTGTLNQGGTAELAPITTSFMWLRTRPQDMGRLLGSVPAEADLAAAVALFPAGVRALITARVDAQIHVSGSAHGHQVSISRCGEPEFLFNELSEPCNATHLLHLLCEPGEDTGYTFVMVELSAGKFVPKGWVTGEEAARYSAEGAKSAPPGARRISTLLRANGRNEGREQFRTGGNDDHQDEKKNSRRN